MARPSKKDISPDEPSAREQLLMAAAKLMTERHTTGISLNDIAAESGLTPAMVRYYFGHRAGMRMAMLRYALGPSIAQLDDLLAMKLAPSEKLRVHIHGVVNTHFRHPYVNRLVHQILADDGDEYGEMIAEEITSPIIRCQKVILEEGLASGEFRAVDPMFFYYHVIGACDHLFYGRYSMKHSFGVKEISETVKRAYIEHLCTTILHGVSAAVPQARR